MDAKTAEMIRGWVNLYRGDTERCARWMRNTLPMGIKTARALIAEAVAA